MVIESLLPGGKERRLVELLKGLQKFPKLKIELILTNSDVYYKEIFDLNIKIYFVEPGTYKKSVIPFFRIYKICKNSNPQIIHVWGNKAAIYSILPKIFLNIPMINSQISDAPKKIKNQLQQQEEQQDPFYSRRSNRTTGPFDGENWETAIHALPKKI